MSYKCGKCKKQIKKGVPQFKITKERKVLTREGNSFRMEIASEKKVCSGCLSDEVVR